jgi:hypothetical protein
MLIHFTWSSYFETAFIALIAYYLFIGLYFYSGEWKRFINSKVLRTNQQEVQTNSVVAEENNIKKPAQGPVGPGEVYPEPDNEMLETELLIARIKATIKEAPQGPQNQQKLIAKLRTIFQDFPRMKTSSYRDAINELVAAQCEASGTALLTPEEVDSWWNE